MSSKAFMDGHDVGKGFFFLAGREAGRVQSATTGDPLV